MMILCSQCRSRCNWVKEEVLEKIVMHIDMLCMAEVIGDWRDVDYVLLLIAACSNRLCAYNKI